MQENVSPNLYYKIFDANDSFTLVFIALNEECKFRLNSTPIPVERYAIP